MSVKNFKFNEKDPKSKNKINDIWWYSEDLERTQYFVDFFSQKMLFCIFLG